MGDVIIKDTNQRISVELTKAGAKRLNQLYISRCGVLRIIPDPSHLRKEGDKYSTTLWELMRDLGSNAGADIPFVNLRNCDY